MKRSFHELEDDKPLEGRLHSACRGPAVRANYLAVYKLDAQLSCKKVRRWMASPSERSWQALRILC